jgi:hypothetical protein
MNVEKFKKWFFEKFVVKRMYKVKRFAHSKKLYTYDKVVRKITSIAGQVFAEEIIASIYTNFVSKYKWYELIIEWLRHNLAVYVSDPIYYSVSQNDLNSIKPTKDHVYQVDVFDCDDFAFLKKGYEEEYGYNTKKNYAFGIIWIYSNLKGVGHAINFYVDNNGILHFYEPQTDSEFIMNDDWRLIVAFI